MKLAFLIALTLSLNSAFGGVCEDRKKKVSTAISKSDSKKNLADIKSKSYELVILGEPHGTHYLEKLPSIIDLLTKDLKCAFIEQPHQLEQNEIDQLLEGRKTKHFQTNASFDYIPFFKYLRQRKVEIIPIDNRLDHPDGISPLDYMTKRDDGMYDAIKQNLKRCGKSLYVVGKHHLTPDISGYDETLGHRLKADLEEKVLIVDMIARKNMEEEYCSYSQNNLFDGRNILLKGNSVGNLSYSTFVNNSFWSDFDYILHLKREIGSQIEFD